MAEVWDQLRSLQSNRQLCLDDALRIRQSCAADHGKQSVFECEECYKDLLQRLKQVYLSEADPEWFSGRRPFLQDLENLFAAAHERETDPRKIEGRIQEEKQKWYREAVRSTANRLIVDETTSRDAILDKLHDLDLSWGDLVNGIREVLGRLASPPSDMEGLIQRLTAAEEPADRIAVYKEAFFPSLSDHPAREVSQKHLELLESGAPMEQIIAHILEDRQASIGARLQREKHLRRLDELRRGRTAHELQKTKKTKDRTTFAEPQVPEELYDLPPCLVCSAAPDTSDHLSCSLCQVLAGLGALDRPTVYCSRDCYDRGGESHIEQTHACASGDDCVLLHGEDVDMEAADADAYLCNECVNRLGTPSVFCSQRCADTNLRTHRESVHSPAWDKRGGHPDDSSNLASGGEDSSRHHAPDIDTLVVPLAQALRDFEKKNGVGGLAAARCK